MVKIGEVCEIWRYPVKGMAGEPVQAGQLGPQGLYGDRIWAVRDQARQEIQSCKFRPDLLQCTASLSEGQGGSEQVEIRFPDGSVLGSTDAAVHARVSALIGHASTLEPLRPLSDLDFYRRHKRDGHTWLHELKATFAREDGEPLPEFFNALPASAAEFVTLPGSFFLVTPFHVLTTATLAWLKNVQPASDWDARRFRPNLLIDTGPATREALIEQDWIGQQLVIGDAALDCPAATPRCGAITRAQHDLPADKSMLRTVVQHAAQNVGIYGTTARSGALRVGDAVYLRPTAQGTA